jgi:hypothetical protein
VQVEIKDISTGEGRLRCAREKQFIHGLITHDPNRRFVGRGGRVSRHDQANTGSFWQESQIRAIEERPACPTLGMNGVLIRRLFEAAGNRRQIKQGIVFAPYDDPQPR